MSEHPATTDWATSRGQRWDTHLDGLESMLAPVIDPLARALDPEGPSRIADIGCGGGGATREILRRAPTGSTAHGYDVSPVLVDTARARAVTDPEIDGEAIGFSVADVSTAPAPAVTHDRLVSRFGIMFFDDPTRAFANLRTWLAPGGRIAFAVWGPPARNPWMTAVREAVEEVAELPAPDPTAPGPFRYAEAATLLDVLDHAGFDDLGAEEWNGRLAVGGGLSAPEAARFALSSLSVGQALAEVDEARTRTAHDSLTATFSAHVSDGLVAMDASVHIVTGRA